MSIRRWLAPSGKAETQKVAQVRRRIAARAAGVLNLDLELWLTGRTAVRDATMLPPPHAHVAGDIPANLFAVARGRGKPEIAVLTEHHMASIVCSLSRRIDDALNRSHGSKTRLLWLSTDATSLVRESRHIASCY